MPEDWNPDRYAAFRGLRLRPALDLVAQIGPAAKGAVVDLGCGDGAAAKALRIRFPGRRLIGVDASSAMLAEARGYDELVQVDVEGWTPAEPVGVIFSNACLQWLPDHGRLIPDLAGLLSPGGVLAVQMPRQQNAPSHEALRATAAGLFPMVFDFADWRPQVAAPRFYHQLLAPLGEVSVWETQYLQRLGPVDQGHPVRHFTQSTAMRPFLGALTKAEQAAFIAAYEDALAAAYPPEPDGSVLFPFRRLFFTLTLPA